LFERTKINNNKKVKTNACNINAIICRMYFNITNVLTPGYPAQRASKPVFYYVCVMTIAGTYMKAPVAIHVILDMSDSYTCSFTEFYPFCKHLYYFSTFKDFNTQPVS